MLISFYRFLADVSQFSYTIWDFYYRSMIWWQYSVNTLTEWQLFTYWKVTVASLPNAHETWSFILLTSQSQWTTH